MTWLQSPIMREFIQLLVYSTGGYAICMVVSRIWKRKQIRLLLQKIDVELTKIGRRLLEKGRANEFAISILFTLSVVVGLCVIAYANRWPIVVEHNLRIEQKVSANQWWIVSDEHPQGFMYYACNDFDNGAWIYEGYYVRQARWQVRDNCNSIRDQGFEFDYVWKADGQAKTIQEAGYGWTGGR